MKNVAFKLSGFFLLSLLVLSCSKTRKLVLPKFPLKMH